MLISRTKEAQPSYIVVEVLKSIWFLVWSNQPHHQQLDWMVAVGMAKPRKAREKERGGAFLRDLKRTSSTTMARVNILVGIRAGRDWWAREERAAHIRWKIKGARGISAHKGSGNMDLPCSHSRTEASKYCPVKLRVERVKGKICQRKDAFQTPGYHPAVDNHVPREAENAGYR